MIKENNIFCLAEGTKNKKFLGTNGREFLVNVTFKGHLLFANVM